MICPACGNKKAYKLVTINGVTMCDQCGELKVEESIESKIYNRIDYVPPSNGAVGGVLIKPKFLP